MKKMAEIEDLQKEKLAAEVSIWLVMWYHEGKVCTHWRRGWGCVLFCSNYLSADIYINQTRKVYIRLKEGDFSKGKKVVN